MTTDVVIEPIIRNILIAGFSAMNIPGVKVKQKYQSRETFVPENGPSDGPVIYFHRISGNRYGFPGVKQTYNSTNDNFDVVESTWRRSTWQISGLFDQDPSDINQLTAMDVVEAASDILQLESTVQTLNNSTPCIGIERITDIRPGYFVSDKDEHEQSPSFDFVLSYQKTFTKTTPRVTGYTLDIKRTQRG